MARSDGEIDPLDFRRASSHYLTGVAVATTLDRDGNPAGLTVNSFSTVSLEPPLVLVCIGEASDTYEAFRAGHGFAVHVLAADQEDLAVRFAAKGIDRFRGVEWSPGHRGLPVLPDCLSVYECETRALHPGGDHVIVVGEVVRLSYAGTERPALGYFRGRYVVQPSPEAAARLS